MSEGLSKKQIKELHKLEKLQSRNLETKQNMVKWLAISFISVLFLIFFIVLIVVGKSKNAPKTADGKPQFASSGGQARMGKLEGVELSTQSAKPNQKIVTMVEYADFQCPACKAYYPIVKNLLGLYPEQLKVVFKHFPISTLHKNAVAAATAAEAAGRQNKFFKLGDILYEKQDEWADLENPQDKFLSYAKEIGLDIEKFKKDQKDAAIAKAIEDDRNEGIKNGVNATPSFFIDGEKLENPPDIKGFQKTIDAKLGISGDVKTPTSAPAAKQLQL
jgi:protein-disulfide isomerase